jgi:hypothetical protein
MPRLTLSLLIGSTLLFCFAPPTIAQFGEETTKGPQYGEERVQQWKVGMVLIARGGPCLGVFGHVSLPTSWPEQEVRVMEQNVKVMEEEFTDNVGAVRYRNLDDNVRLMQVTVPKLAVSERASALVTVEIARRTIAAPADTSILKFSNTPPRDVRKFLASSPLIECRKSEIRSKVKEITADCDGAWETVETIHDWVKENIEHRNSSLEGAVATLRNEYGNHEDLTNLFVAFCRAAKIPARIVWVPEYCYAEFYLEDDEGEGHWFPCELKEKTEFGVISEPYPILQKGDNIRVPGKKQPQRFVAEFLTGKAGRGLGKPSVQFVRQLVQ